MKKFVSLALLVVILCLAGSICAFADDVDEKIAEAKNKKERTEQQLIETQNQLESSKKQIEQLRKQNNKGSKSQQNEINSLRKQAAQQKKQITSQKNEINELKSRIKELEQQKISSSSNISMPSKFQTNNNETSNYPLHPQAKFQISKWQFKPGDKAVILTILYPDGDTDEIPANKKTKNKDTFFLVENLPAGLQVILPDDKKGTWVINCDGRKDYVKMIVDPNNITESELSDAKNHIEGDGKTFKSGKFWEAFIYIYYLSPVFLL